ncbi:aldehyde dehydrogenase [Breoghania sp. L-A4]|uniref:aldehyde dehydrogenase n=1 Tax=Breoghania sp. L-A4 TaxID=2304600 RepID=UPI000E35B6B2|nr:aldehyde dehydrogenase [Breoghania sp. L-A4]AXS41266.1 aldehyde dehydrogenase [Breoghania sp. L-A4]
MLDAALLIRNESVAASGAATFDRMDPVTRGVATRAAAASVEDAVHAANVAASAFPAWSGIAPGERREMLNRAAQVLLDKTEEFVAAIVSETGGTRIWAEFNCRIAASLLREAGAMTTQITGEVIPSERAGSFSMATRQPCGVVLGIAPWNAPVILGARAVAMPLACGNTVVLKASELCPRTHGLIGEVFQEAGFPAGTVNVVSSAPEDAPRIVEALIAHAAVRRVNFTGSTRVGRIVAEVGARHLKRCLLELGGKAPMIVLDDADLEAAVNAATFGAFFHQGQICMSTERILVDESIADAFLERFRLRAESLKAGDPRDPKARLGAMITEQAATRVKGLIDDAVHKGARLVTGGGQHDVFVDATILDGVTSAMRIYHEESFGPVASVIRVDGVEEAISIANDTEYGLAAAVFGRDVGRALGVAQRIESGICHINAATIHDEPQMPFGGVKASGYGRFGGKAGIDEFTELRWISIQTGELKYPI